MTNKEIIKQFSKEALEIISEVKGKRGALVLFETLYRLASLQEAYEAEYNIGINFKSSEKKLNLK